MNKFIVVNLHNIPKNTYHPALYYEVGDEHPNCYLYAGRHENGFTTRDESIAECHRTLNTIQQEYGQCELCINKDFAWDGEELITHKLNFNNINGILQPSMD